MAKAYGIYKQESRKGDIRNDRSPKLLLMIPLVRDVMNTAPLKRVIGDISSSNAHGGGDKSAVAGIENRIRARIRNSDLISGFVNSNVFAWM